MTMLLLGGGLCLSALPAAAAEASTYNFELPPEDLGDALRSVAARAGWEVYAAAAAVNGIKSPPIHGAMTAHEAIEKLLAGSGLTARFMDKAVIIRAKGGDTGEASGPPSPQIVVTGSRIRGADVAAPTIRVTRQDIEEAGQSDLGEAMRSIPQNFGGGQNPGVGSGAGLVNSNVNSASSIDLRGLGPDATLTLLNGHRLPYDSAFSGVDVSAIPLAAIDRVEIVTDGASALYGSDAVAGVANVILRRDFEGVTTSTRLGTATEGGDFSQQIDVVTGTRWTTGGFMLAYDFQHNLAISAAQRSYASSLSPDNSLYPSQRHHALTLAAHQDIASGITMNLDALWSKRWSTTLGGITDEAYRFAPTLQTFSIAPEIVIDLGATWSLKISGAYGQDNTRFNTSYIPTTGTASVTSGCFCSSAASIEGNVEGPLFHLPGGDARIAAGVGYRDDHLAYSSATTGYLSSAFDAGRTDDYAYGELYFPVIGSQQGIAGIDRLNLSAALRYENYPGMAKLATPRFGLVYAPVHSLSLQASWSRSFKAPTLYEQYIGYQTYLLPAAAYGVGPAGSTVLYASGGNPALKPERARNWTAGFEWKPQAAPGLSLSASYFNIAYRNRVVEPIPGSISAAFTQAGYGSVINIAPSAAELASLIAGSQLGLQNYSGSTYDPSAVYALVDNRNINVADQAIHGIDGHGAWKLTLASTRSLTFDIAATWLVSHQQLTSSLPSTQLAGTVFSPPNVRAKGSVLFQSERLHLGTFVNYTGGLTDPRFVPASKISPHASLDATTSYVVIPGPPQEPGLEISLIIDNLFDMHPPQIGTTGPTDTPYDSTNYSPIGRFVAIGLSRHW